MAADPFAAYDTPPSPTSAPPATSPAAATPAAPTNDNSVSMGLVPTYDAKGQWIGYERSADAGGKTATPDQGPVVVTPAAKAPIDVAGATAVPVATIHPPAAAKSTAPRSSPIPMADPFAAFDQSAPPASGASASPAPPTTVTPVVAAPVMTPQTPSDTPPLHPMLQQELRNQPWYQPITNAITDTTAGLQSLEHGASMGLDEILDPLIPAISKSLSQGIPFSQAYDQAVDERRGARKEFEQRNPKTGTALEAAGSVVPATVSAPLFAESAPGLGVGARLLNYGRNIAAGAGTSAAQSAGMAEGDAGQRLQAAEQGAGVGAGLAAVVPPVAKALGSGVASLARAVTPGRQVDPIVGRILNEASGGPVPFGKSPIPGAPLNIGQSSGNAGLAGLVDTRHAANVAAMKAEQTGQNAAIIGHVPSSPGTNVAPEAAAARGSQRFVRGVQSGSELSNTEERRVWNTKALTDKNMSSQSSKTSVATAIARLERDSPGLHDSMMNSGAIRSVIRDLDAMPDNVSANELNSIASRLKKIGRNPGSDDAERLVAKQLSGAAHDGLWNAPEVTGRPTQTIPGLPARTEMHTLSDGAVVPVHIAATPDTIVPAVKPIPGLVRDLNAARAFTKQEAETFGHASFDAIVGRNSYGNQTVAPGTAANRFFDFTNGTEKPGAIKDVGKFLDDIKSSWLKLGQVGSKYDPAGVSMAQTEIKEGLREYIASKFLATVSTSNLDSAGNQMVSAAKTSDWLANNAKLLMDTGVYTRPELDAWQRVYDYARLINKGNNLGTPKGSPTYTRFMNDKRWLDMFMGPLAGAAAGSAISAAIGGTIGHFLGEGSLGAILGAEGGAGAGFGAAVLHRIYSAPRAQLIARLDEAIANPDIAKDLMQKATTKAGFSPATKRWFRSWLASEPAAQATRANQPAQPEPAQ